MDVLLQSYYILLPIIATALIGWVGVLLKDQKKKEQIRENEIKKKEDEQKKNQKAQSLGIMLVLRYMLRRYHSEYMLQGKITYNQYKDWQDMYEAYSTLGGNSIAEEWNNDIEKIEKCDSASEMSLYEIMLRNNTNNSHS